MEAVRKSNPSALSGNTGFCVDTHIVFERLTVTTVKVYDLLHRRALITRESAHVIKDAIAPSVSAEGEINLDFSGIDAVTPSFIDEILLIVDEAVSHKSAGRVRVVFTNAPTRLSSKFAAIGRGHGANIVESSLGSWEITRGEHQ
jgi:hypothetical protein